MPSPAEYYNNTKNINFKFIPSYDGNNSNWRVNQNLEGETVPTFALFQKNNTENYINFPTSSINSETYSFTVIKSGNTIAGGLFKIKSVRVHLSETLSKYIKLSSIGFNTDRTAVGTTTGSTVTSSFGHKKYILEKDTHGMYVNNNIPDDQLIIDTDTSNDKLFSFWIDSITPVDKHGQPTTFTQLKIDHNIGKLVLFNMEIEGEYINENLKYVNRNLLSTSVDPLSTFSVNIFEYNKTMSIFELDTGNETNNKIGPNQIGELNLKKITNTVHVKSDTPGDYIQYRKYDIGSGILYNADISAFHFLDTELNMSPALNIKKLRIKNGLFLSKSDSNGANKKVDAFFFRVDDRDVHLLPNNLDPYVYVIIEPVEESTLNVYYTRDTRPANP
jgi:hypothetical protein